MTNFFLVCHNFLVINDVVNDFPIFMVNIRFLVSTFYRRHIFSMSIFKHNNDVFRAKKKSIFGQIFHLLIIRKEKRSKKDPR